MAIGNLLSPFQSPVLEYRLQWELRVSDISESEARAHASNAEHDSVSPYWVVRLSEYLEESEQLEGIISGGKNWGLRIVEGNTSTRKGGQPLMNPLAILNNAGRANALAVTSDRVLIFVYQLSGNDIHSIPFDSINGIDHEEGMPSKITIQTTGRTYHFDVDPPSPFLTPERFRNRTNRALIQDMVSMIRERREDSQGTTDTSDLEQLERLHELHEKGALTDTEFEQKKEEMLDAE